MKIPAISLAGARSIVSRLLPGHSPVPPVAPLGSRLPTSAAAEVLVPRHARQTQEAAWSGPPAAVQRAFSMPPRQPVPVRSHAMQQRIPSLGRPATAPHVPAGPSRVNELLRSRWDTQQRHLGASWIGSLQLRTETELRGRTEALHAALASQSRAMKMVSGSGNSLPRDGELLRGMAHRRAEVQAIDQELRSRHPGARAVPVPAAAPRRTLSMPVTKRPLGAEVWTSAAISRVPTLSQPLSSLPAPALRQRRDALVLARGAHDTSLQWFQRSNGSLPFGHDLLKREMNGYAREINAIDAILRQRTGV